MKTIDDTHSVDRGVGAYTFDAAPLACVKVEKVDLIASAYVEVARVEVFWIVELHGENIHLGWKTGDGAVFDP